MNGLRLGFKIANFTSKRNWFKFGIAWISRLWGSTVFQSITFAENNEKLEALSFPLYVALLICFVAHNKSDPHSYAMFNYQAITVSGLLIDILNKLINTCCFVGFGISSKLWDYPFGTFPDKLNVKAA